MTGELALTTATKDSKIAELESANSLLASQLSARDMEVSVRPL